METDFSALVEKAKKLAERRSLLQAQEQSLLKQIEETKAALVREFGENYQELFSEAVEKIRKWDADHAGEVAGA
jgi:uncharacterized pyridoxal phosphate-containing UPF0001 family protein